MLGPVLVTQACAAYIASASLAGGAQSIKALVHSVHSVLMLRTPMPKLQDAQQRYAWLVGLLS